MPLLHPGRQRVLQRAIGRLMPQDVAGLVRCARQHGAS
jgi:hypothetical protein